jgi:hypothetical protein
MNFSCFLGPEELTLGPEGRLRGGVGVLPADGALSREAGRPVGDFLSVGEVAGVVDLASVGGVCLLEDFGVGMRDLGTFDLTG